VAIETYLRSNFAYTLDIPAPPINQDVVDYFLFDLKKGYCDYFATSMAVLARAAGLPSRIVVGYASGSYNPFKAEYEITQADAHAWTEIYFSGIGWVEFEPTPGRPGIARPLQGIAPASPKIPAAPQNGFGNFNTLLRQLSGLTGWGVFAIIGPVLLGVLLQVAEFWLLTHIPTPRALRWIYRGIFRLGRALIGRSPRGETAGEFAAALQAKLTRLSQPGGRLVAFFAPSVAELDLLTGLYLRALYAPRTPPKRELRQALPAWQSLRWRLLLARMIPLKDNNG
jgi:hypothetical protein